MDEILLFQFKKKKVEGKQASTFGLKPSARKGEKADVTWMCQAFAFHVVIAMWKRWEWAKMLSVTSKFLRIWVEKEGERENHLSLSKYILLLFP